MMGTRTRRTLAGGLLLVGSAVIGIPIAAYRDMERERRARSYLGDRLYTRHIEPEPSALGLGVAASAVALMPLLAAWKRRLNRERKSAALC